MTERRLCYRLCKVAFAPGLDGEGARLSGGRWNPIGSPAVYASESVALCVLETFVHMPPGMRRSGAFPNTALVALTVDPDQIEYVELGSVLKPDAQKEFGADWLSSCRSVALSVPSAVLQMERNILLNPLHPDLSKSVDVASIDAFEYDPRMSG